MTAGAHSETFPALDAECPEAWLARRLAAGKPAESWVPVPGWYYEQIGLPVPAVPHQVSDQGRIRNATGHVLSSAPTAGRRNCRRSSSTASPTCAQAARRPRSLSITSCWPVSPPRSAPAGKPATSARVTRTARGTGTPKASPGATSAENAFDKPPEVRAAAAVKARAAQTAAGTAKPPRPTFQCLSWARAEAWSRTRAAAALPAPCRSGRTRRSCSACACRRRPSASSSATRRVTGCSGWRSSMAATPGCKAEARMQRPTLWQRVRLMQVKRRIKRGMR